MKKMLLLNCFILFFYSQYKSQSICLDIDSIVVEYLPWTFHSRISIQENDFFSIKRINSGLKKKVITNSVAIKEFSNIDLVRKNNISPIKNIDVRMSIKVYASSYNTTILIDKSKMYYKNSTEVYTYSSLLFEWINKYILFSN